MRKIITTQMDIYKKLVIKKMMMKIKIKNKLENN